MRFVMVPGGWQGGWVYDEVAAELRASGHDVDQVTLAGLGDNDADPTRPPDLEDHVRQVVGLLEPHDDRPVALCGHSYAGLVIAAVADRLPGRLEHLVFLDAYVPDDGDSCWSLTSDAFRAAFVEGTRADGRWVAVPDGMDARARPHPLPSFLQAVRLSGRVPRARRTYVSGGAWAGSPFTGLTRRLRSDPGWTVHEIPVGHNIARRDPHALAELLLSLDRRPDAVSPPPTLGDVPDAVFADPRLAPVYDLFNADRSDLGPYLDIVTELGASSVLDVGCGTGVFALALGERGLEVTGVDPAAASVEVARSKPGADRVRFLDGDATTLPPMRVDLATMTGNVAQVLLTDDDWAATLVGIHDALRPGGHLVFESRDPERRVWEDWTRDWTPERVNVEGVGEIVSSAEVTRVDGPFVTFEGRVELPDGTTVPTASTLRFRSRAELETSLAAAGFAVDEVRDAPDRPGHEFVVIAVRRSADGERTQSPAASARR